MNSPLHPLKRSLLPPDLLRGLENGGKLEVNLPGVGRMEISLTMLLFMDVDTIKLLVHHIQQEPQSCTLKGIKNETISIGVTVPTAGHIGSSSSTTFPSSSSAAALPVDDTTTNIATTEQPHPIASLLLSSSLASEPQYENHTNEQASSIHGNSNDNGTKSSDESNFTTTTIITTTTASSSSSIMIPSSSSSFSSSSVPSTTITDTGHPILYHTITVPVGHMHTILTSSVKIAGSFDEWKNHLPLELTKDQQAFEITLGFTDKILSSSSSAAVTNTPYIYHYSQGTELHFKFIIDHQNWHCDHEQTSKYPIIVDRDGHHNHIFRV